MSKGKALAFATVGAGALAAFALSGSARASEQEPPKPKPKPKPKPTSSRISLSTKFAKMFGVPLSLILATTKAQSNNRANVSAVNKRGGAWGYGQITLDTAKEIWPRIESKVGKTWNGTGQELLDPTINLALTAYYLSLWWRRYKNNKRGWILSAYAYVLGPGRVRKVMPNDSGDLPKTLPTDFAKVKSRFSEALKTSEVKKALSGDVPILGYLGAELYGKALANEVPATTTGNQARSIFGKITAQLSRAYGVLQAYDPTGIAKASRIDAGSIDAARNYLDSTNEMLQKYYKDMPQTDTALTSSQLTKLKAAVSTSSVAIKTVDDLFGTTFWKELTTEVLSTASTIINKTAKALAPTIGIVAAGALGVGVLILAIKK